MGELGLSRNPVEDPLSINGAELLHAQPSDVLRDVISEDVDVAFLRAGLHVSLDVRDVV